ncbi:redox-regulated ATPase YchF, partial [Patescibacteria group bacterium]|nr:redox-regulated ATPase YchF [Patescibacteria group bacterium]
IVPDERLEKIAKVVKPEKITPTIIEFVDIAGLVKGAHKGEGLGNQFLAQIRNCDAILEITRAFDSSNIEHVAGAIDPKRDIGTIKLELLMKDLETIEGQIQSLKKDTKTRDKKSLKKLEFLEKISQALSQEKLIPELDLAEEERIELKNFQLLTAKPVAFVLNIDEKKPPKQDISNIEGISLDLKIEEEISELSEKEAKELRMRSSLDQIILTCYNILDLITFFTIAGGKETRAWTLKRGSCAPKAGGKVHSDFEEKFIRAEIINWQKLIEAESWSKARESGLLNTMGKEYIIQDGDVIEFKI